MHKKRTYQFLGILFAITLLAGLFSIAPAMAQGPAVFINEIHYDNDGTDAGEAIEIAGTAGTDLTGWSLVLYNGNGGAPYNTTDLTGYTLPDLENGFGIAVVSYPSNGIQNGSPDGLALVDSSSTVVQFLSYEGTFTAVGGPADGMTSTDIGVSEPGTTLVGDSLQLTGTGSEYADFTWAAPAANTFGAVNTGQTFSGSVVTWINEIHYDNDGTDTGEAIEIAGTAGTDLTGWSIVLYNGNGGAPYNTADLTGYTLPDLGNGFGIAVVSYPSNGIQNGSPDGLALVDSSSNVVQFLSYEGSFTAVGGPADGMTSTDIGVSEPGTTLVGDSLQLTGTGSKYDDFTWAAPAANTFGAVNNGQTFESSGTPVIPGQALPLDEGFDDCTLAGWEIISVDADAAHTWSCNATYSNIEANGYGDSAPANEWLITPPLNMDAQENDILTFRSYTRYSDIDYPQLHVLYSTNYDGGGDPTSATWTELTGITYSPENSSQWTDSGKVDISGVSGIRVYFAFQYVSSGTTSGSAATWRLDGISFESDPLRQLPFYEGFDDCTLAGWDIFSVDADAAHTWACNATYSNIEANGYGDSAPANDWLITPPLDMDAQVDEVLTFRSYTRYTDIDYPQVHVFYSTDYDGNGDPTTATWTELTGITFSPENSTQWTDSGKVDISAVSGEAYFAFQYVSSGTTSGSAATWRLDEITFEVNLDKKIHEVQGTGDVSPYVGQTVAIEGIVVGDFQDGTAGTNGDLNGFFVQEEDFDVDGDPLTSEGIFVYDGNSPAVDVAIGDLVSVTGTVSEYFGFTEITSYSGVKVLGSEELPTASVLSLPVSSLADFEAFESMLVTVPQPLYISEYYNFGRYGEIVLTSARQFQPSALYDPASPDAFNLLAENALDRITLDDGRTTQNPDPAIHPDGAIFDMNNLFRGGDTVQNVTGVINYSYDLYRIQPTQGADYTSENPRTAEPEYVGDGLKVSSFNVLNYFTTIDTGAWICGPSGDMECRGADDAEELARQRSKIVAALAAIDADVVGLIEIENGAGDVPVADLVSGLNDMVGAGTYDYIATGDFGSDAIRQAFIYKTATVTPVGDYALLDTAAFLDPLGSGTDKNRPALAQTFIDNETGGIFTAVVNHLKSKGSACDGDFDDIAGNCNLTRTLSAEELVKWLATDPTGSGDGDFLIIGDLNSYDKEDPIDALIAGGFADMVYAYQGEYAYSYVFDGQLGYLDHALANSDLAEEISGVTIWHINADEPSLIDYDTSFKLPAQDALFAPDPYRSSDHDPVIVGLDVCDEIAPVFESLTATPDMLWPANHKYVDVTVEAIVSDNFDQNPTVTLLSVTSSEDDNGLGDGDTPDDIVMIDDFTFMLRAERSAVNGEGRTYTLTYQVTDACGNFSVQSVTVFVPFSQK